MDFILYLVALVALNVLTPSAVFVLTLKIATDAGRKAGIAMGLGLVTADLVYATCALVGVSAMLRGHESVVAIVPFLRGAWIVHIGLKLCYLPFAAAPAGEQPQKTQVSAFQAYQKGAVSGFANPQEIILFASVFAFASSGIPLLEGIFLLAGIGLVSLVLRCGLVTVASTQKVLSLVLAHKRRIQRTTGGLFVFFGAKITAKAGLAMGAKAVVLYVLK